jgi:hypothetical protein
MPHLIITKNPGHISGCSSRTGNFLPSEIILLSVACKELSKNRPVYQGNDLRGTGIGNLLRRCFEPDKKMFQVACKDEIVRFEAKGKETTIILKSGETYSTIVRLEVFTAKLHDHLFYLANPDNLINLMYMERLNRSAASVVLRNSDTVTITAGAEIQLLELFNKTDIFPDNNND